MAKLTIILGKNLGKMSGVDVTGRLIFFPEVSIVSGPPGQRYLPQHPDAFVPETVEWIRELTAHGWDVQLWTLSEYLVNRIAADVQEFSTYWGIEKTPYGLLSSVEVRLYADDNQSFRRFGISSEGYLEDVGDGGWPFGWFMPSN